MSDKAKTLFVLLSMAILGAGIVIATKTAGRHPTATHHTGEVNNKSSFIDEAQQTNTVVYQDFSVKPSVIKVKKGTTVRWTNQDTAKHDVTPNTETAEFKASQLFGKGESYEVMFNTPGIHTYFCSPHPFMKGSIEVVE